MSDTVMRGVVALPGSKAISRIKGTCRNLGSLVGSFGLVAEGGVRQGTTIAVGRAETRWRIGM
jgi:hypothetical protein